MTKQEFLKIIKYRLMDNKNYLTVYFQFKRFQLEIRDFEMVILTSRPVIIDRLNWVVVNPAKDELFKNQSWAYDYTDNFYTQYRSLDQVYDAYLYLDRLDKLFAFEN